MLHSWEVLFTSSSEDLYYVLVIPMQWLSWEKKVISGENSRCKESLNDHFRCTMGKAEGFTTHCGAHFRDGPSPWRLYAPGTENVDLLIEHFSLCLLKRGLYLEIIARATKAYKYTNNQAYSSQATIVFLLTFRESLRNSKNSVTV